VAKKYIREIQIERCIGNHADCHKGAARAGEIEAP
jgi:hypothetical protein